MHSGVRETPEQFVNNEVIYMLGDGYAYYADENYYGSHGSSQDYGVSKNLTIYDYRVCVYPDAPEHEGDYPCYATLLRQTTTTITEYPGDTFDCPYTFYQCDVIPSEWYGINNTIAPATTESQEEQGALNVSGVFDFLPDYDCNVVVEMIIDPTQEDETMYNNYVIAAIQYGITDKCVTWRTDATIPISFSYDCVDINDTYTEFYDIAISFTNGTLELSRKYFCGESQCPFLEYASFDCTGDMRSYITYPDGCHSDGAGGGAFVETIDCGSAVSEEITAQPTDQTSNQPTHQPSKNPFIYSTSFPSRPSVSTTITDVRTGAATTAITATRTGTAGTGSITAETQTTSRVTSPHPSKSKLTTTANPNLEYLLCTTVSVEYSLGNDGKRRMIGSNTRLLQDDCDFQGDEVSDLTKDVIVNLTVSSFAGLSKSYDTSTIRVTDIVETDELSSSFEKEFGHAFISWYNDTCLREKFSDNEDLGEAIVIGDIDTSAVGVIVIDDSTKSPVSTDDSDTSDSRGGGNVNDNGGDGNIIIWTIVMIISYFKLQNHDVQSSRQKNHKNSKMLTMEQNQIWLLLVIVITVKTGSNGDSSVDINDNINDNINDDNKTRDESHYAGDGGRPSFLCWVTADDFDYS